MKITENPDKELVAIVKEGLKRRNGYCPCRREDKPEYKVKLFGNAGGR